MAINEEWLKAKGAILVCRGDWEDTYALGSYFYVIDQTFKTLNRIISHWNNPGLSELHQIMVNPCHIRCKQVLYQPQILMGSDEPWFCDCCGISLAV